MEIGFERNNLGHLGIVKCVVSSLMWLGAIYACRLEARSMALTVEGIIALAMVGFAYLLNSKRREPFPAPPTRSTSFLLLGLGVAVPLGGFFVFHAGPTIFMGAALMSVFFIYPSRFFYAVGAIAIFLDLWLIPEASSGRLQLAAGVLGMVLLLDGIDDVYTDRRSRIMTGANH